VPRRIPSAPRTTLAVHSKTEFGRHSGEKERHMKFDSKIVQRLILIRTLCSDDRGRRQTAVKKISGILFLSSFRADFFPCALGPRFTSPTARKRTSNPFKILKQEMVTRIMVPAGAFSWTARLNITKGITIQGQRTISGAGTANPISLRLKAG
jgi:hypothetical protein